ncbi:MAG: hypothetical protein EZS28_045960 [Streblomastix strix]|uniref:Uncharacterized protein n=1 Tax=Streblomastix strix TaxID=222440 RepID=A0A5J4TL89_9EUKA|nr:MAG: hypothetical protein EZS28_045960 [Streblomastix strix]
MRNVASQLDYKQFVDRYQYKTRTIIPTNINSTSIYVRTRFIAIFINILTTVTTLIIVSSQRQSSGSENNLSSNQTPKQSNFGSLMDIVPQSRGHEINSSLLEVKINQASFNRQRDLQATKSYLSKYIGKQETSLHHYRYRAGEIEGQEVIQSDS